MKMQIDTDNQNATNSLHCTLLPEWHEQSGIMLTWPHAETLWVNMLDDIDAVFVEVAREVTMREPLLITCYDQAHQKHILDLLDEANVNLAQVAIFLAPSNDIWVRDHGPLTAIHQAQPILLDFAFNGWGQKYPFHLDNQITKQLHTQGAFGDTTISTIDMVLEGGSVDVDGEGTLLTTSECLLASSRNPNMTKEEIEITLKRTFGLKKILWLDHGYLAGDDTDSHIDTLARFVNPETICYMSCDDQTDEHYESLKKMEKQLQSFTNYAGKPYNLIPLPWPRAQFAKSDGHRLPATYANFLIINGAVLVPIYNDPQDVNAMLILSRCFPGRQIIGINAIPVIQWHGSIHCMTMQLPVGVLS